MSTIPEPLRVLDRSHLHPPAESLHGSFIYLFSPGVRASWALLGLLLIAAGVIPIIHLPPIAYYIYYVSKVLLYLAVGYASPLAFNKLNSIGFGVLTLLVCAVAIEIAQGFIRGGHSFYWHELIGKFCLITIGAAIALNNRYEKRISVGPFQISLRTNEPS